MLGCQLWRHLLLRFPDTYATLRKTRKDYNAGLPETGKVIDHVDANDFPALWNTLAGVKPDFILNCIAITKRRENAKDTIPSIMLNALLPHKLAEWGLKTGARIINFSTDCVFDGKQGNYTEDSQTSAADLYGKTKALGETTGENTLTLRTSFIGRELNAKTELLEWFLAQREPVRGFKNAMYSGLTTLEMSRIVEKILTGHPDAAGLYNVSSDPISKFDLLMLIKKKMHLDIEIIPDETFHCDRSLDSSKFRREFNYTPPAWETMVEELSKEREKT